MRLIDADALAEKRRPPNRTGHLICQMVRLQDVLDAPTIEAKPVVHGEWEPVETEEEFGTVYEYRCSLCGKHSYFDTNFCPACGADMRERKER